MQLFYPLLNLFQESTHIHKYNNDIKPVKIIVWFRSFSFIIYASWKILPSKNKSDLNNSHLCEVSFGKLGLSY